MTKLAALAFPLVTTLAGCWGSTPPKVEPTKPAGGVTVDVAAVTLADDCGDGATQPPPQAGGAPLAQDQARMSMPATGACAPGATCNFSPPCEATSMQLSVRSTADQPTRIQIKRVELIDPQNKPVGELVPRAPSAWTNDHYTAWDQIVAPGATLATSYLLSAPAWDSIEGGKWGAAGKEFTLRVTLAIGDSDQTVHKVALVAPARIAPPIVT